MTRAKILVVDDEPFNVDYLAQELDDLGYDVLTAANGAEALERVRTQPPDLVLLDIMMPVMDGFAVLERLKADAATRDLPVVIISAVTDLASIVRGIASGAEDWLPKPFEPVLLEARMRAGLERKLRRDREIEYLRQVEMLTAAARSVQASAYDQALVAGVAARDDALGNLARVFRSMANEVVAREQRLRRQLRQLQLDIEEQRQAVGHSLASYVPMDRRQALARGSELGTVSTGTALFADISGFTPLTEAFARELGLQRGAEEITRHVNRVLDALIACVHRFRGSVVSFGGDALTCWFEGDAHRRAARCATAMQRAMEAFTAIELPNGAPVRIGLKVALACGSVRRMLVGDADLQRLDILAGRVIDALGHAERHAEGGEIVATRDVVALLAACAHVRAWRAGDTVAAIDCNVSGADPTTWPDLASAPLDPELTGVFVPPAVRDKVRVGHGAFLAELRPAASLFLRFEGLDYDDDPDAERKLDGFTRHVQSVAARHDGTLLQLSTGDKGSHFHLAFGAPVAHYDDAARAVRTALELQNAAFAFPFVNHVAVGIAYGPIRAGAYGSDAQRAYSVIGDSVNLAARLMMEADPNSTLCDAETCRLASDEIAFEALPPVAVKGKSLRVDVYRPLRERTAKAGMNVQEAQVLIDRLPPAEQSLLKIASIAGREFDEATLHGLLPDGEDVSRCVDALVASNLLTRLEPAGARLAFTESAVQDAAYERMPFGQRRHLHRSLAQWYERTYTQHLGPHFATLAHHWRAADEPRRAVEYLERAAEWARANGALSEAKRLFDESLAIEQRHAVLSTGYVK